MLNAIEIEIYLLIILIASIGIIDYHLVTHHACLLYRIVGKVYDTLNVCMYIYIYILKNHIYIYIYIYIYVCVCVCVCVCMCILSLRKNKNGHIRIINLFPSCYGF